MLRPSGSAPITVTPAPARLKTSGEIGRRLRARSRARRAARPAAACRGLRRRGRGDRPPRTPRRPGGRGSGPLGQGIRHPAEPELGGVPGRASLAERCPRCGPRRHRAASCHPVAKNLMPLSGAGLWVAEIMTPKSAEVADQEGQRRGRHNAAGTRQRRRSASPATTAASRNSPEIRGSRATTAIGRDRMRAGSANAPLTEHVTAAAASSEARLDGQVRSPLSREPRPCRTTVP